MTSRPLLRRWLKSEIAKSRKLKAEHIRERTGLAKEFDIEIRTYSLVLATLEAGKFEEAIVKRRKR
jgi:hypothetical protein